MLLDDETRTGLKDELKAIKKELKRYQKIESGEEVGGFMGMVKGIAETLNGFGIKLPKIFEKAGFLDGVGNFVCEKLTGQPLTDFFNEFKKEENINDIKGKLEEKMKDSPLLGIFNQFLDSVAGAKDMAAVKIDEDKLEELQERRAEIEKKLQKDEALKDRLDEAAILAEAKKKMYGGKNVLEGTNDIKKGNIHDGKAGEKEPDVPTP